MTVDNSSKHRLVKVMVGADLSGIELRMLAHYLAKYDAGRYADVLLNGDIHQVNADKLESAGAKLKQSLMPSFTEQVTPKSVSPLTLP